MSLLLPSLKRWYPQFKHMYSRCFAVSIHRNGLEEFFPPGVCEGNNYVEEEPVAGRAWKASELRIRSNTDLHKFWYVLLKEKNMLLTIDHECKRLGIPVPGPTRLNKVERSMKLVEIVIKEREKAIFDLEKQRKYKFDAVENSEDTNTTVKAHSMESSDFHKQKDEEINDTDGTRVKL